MSIHFQSWEALFGISLLLTISFPLLARIVQNEIYLFLTLCLFPLTPMILEHIFVPGDLSFCLKLSFFHWHLSLLSIFLLWISVSRRPKHFYVLLLLSALLSLSKYLFSPSLIFMDPFWGIIPGTISIDPIITLTPYYVRALLLVGSTALIIEYRSAFAFVLIFFLLNTLLGIALPTGNLISRALPKSFKDRAKFGNIEVYLQSIRPNSFSANAWARQFAFLTEELQRRLPIDAKPLSNAKFKIFIYDSNDSKARWIGARQTQIGNFIKGELHLSQVSPKTELLGHELSHLLHGQIKAPIKSYLDPFLLEGVAIALSQKNSERTFDEASALVQTLGLKTWPRYLNFFLSYPPRAAYALAGGFALRSFSLNFWPWDERGDELEFFRMRRVSEQSLEKARKILKMKSPLKDPLRRDCARLEETFYRSENLQDLKKLEDLCPNWRENPSYIPPKSDLQILEEDLGRISDENLRAQERRFYQTVMSGDSKALASEILSHGGFEENSGSEEFEEFNRRLNWELEH